LYGAFRQSLLTKGDNFQHQSRRRTVVILVKELYPYLQHFAELRSHAHFFIHGLGSIALAGNLKSAQVAAAFKPGMAEKIVEFAQRVGQRHCHVDPVLLGVTSFDG
jgi:hypothetical protein